MQNYFRSLKEKKENKNKMDKIHRKLNRKLFGSIIKNVQETVVLLSINLEIQHGIVLKKQGKKGSKFVINFKI